MMLSKLADWRVKVLTAAKEKGREVDFRVLAIKQSNGGYVVCGSANGVEVIVSSQRQDKRIFKSLDTLYGALLDCGIPHFEIVVTK